MAGNTICSAVTEVDAESKKFTWILDNWKLSKFLSKSGNILGPEYETQKDPVVKIKTDLVLSGQYVHPRVQFFGWDASAKTVAVVGTIAVENMSGDRFIKSDGMAMSRSKTWQFDGPEIHEQDLGDTRLKIVVDLQLSSKACDITYGPLKSKTDTSISSLHQLSDDFETLSITQGHHDLLIRVQNQTYQCHKAVLVARSPVFKAMLEHPMEETQTSQINIDDTSAAAWEKFQHFLYSAKISFNDVEVRECEEILYLADKYDVQTLREEVAVWLESILDRQNVLTMMEVGERFQLTDLEQRAFECFLNHVSYFKEEIENEEVLTRISKNKKLMKMLMKRF